jgi:hypothetical protein
MQMVIVYYGAELYQGEIKITNKIILKMRIVTIIIGYVAK